MAIKKTQNAKRKTQNGFTFISAGRLARLMSSQWRSSDINVQPQRGFTLIELLIVVAVLGILGYIAVDLFSSVLKGTNKASTVAEVKQNGQFISDTLERHIRSASNIEVSGNTMNLATFMGTETVTFVPGCDPDLGCTPARNGQIVINGAPVNNTDTVKGVDVTAATFALLPTLEGSPKVVQVDVTLNQAVEAPTRKDFEAIVRLVNTYSLRTY